MGSGKTKTFNYLGSSNLNKPARCSKDNPLFIYLLLIFKTLPPQKDLQDHVWNDRKTTIKKKKEIKNTKQHLNSSFISTVVFLPAGRDFLRLWWLLEACKGISSSQRVQVSTALLSLQGAGRSRGFNLPPNYRHQTPYFAELWLFFHPTKGSWERHGHSKEVKITNSRWEIQEDSLITTRFRMEP